MKIAMFGHKRIPSREGGVEIVVEELAKREAALGNDVTVYNRKGHHVSGSKFDSDNKSDDLNGVKIKTVFTFQNSKLNAIVYSFLSAIRVSFSRCDVVQLQSHSRNYREKRQRQGVVRRTMDKIIALQEYEEAANKKKSQVYQYIKNNRLCIEEIHDVISPDLRISILQWISLANMNTSKTGSTEFGEKYILRREKGNCVLHCEDGDITMPRYILEFEK